MNIYFHLIRADPETKVLLRSINHKLDQILHLERMEAMSMERIRQATERTEGVSASIRKHVEETGKYIRENLDNKVALAELAEKLENQAAAEEAAILANPLPGTVVPPQPAPA